MGDLERDIGELKGALQQFVPTVERISNRVNENRDKITESSKDLELHKKEVWHAIRTLETDTKAHAKDDDGVHRRVDAMEREVVELAARSKGLGRFALRIVEMVIAAVIGGAAALAFGG